MFGAILRAIQNAIDWLFGFLMQGVDALLQTIGDIIPGLNAIDFGPITAALSTANQFVPLDLMFVYLGFFGAYVVVYAITKITIKLIPFGIG